MGSNFFRKILPNLPPNHQLLAFAAAAGVLAKNESDGDLEFLKSPKTVVCTDKKNAKSLEMQISMARDAVRRHMAIIGTPGISVGVSRDGHTIWREGFGFADLETGAPCTGHSVMRIASISKPITAAIAGRLTERGKLDLDKSIHEYLAPDQFPEKAVDGKKVQITARQLLSHTSGIRHYPKKKETDPDSTSTEFFSNKHFANVSEALAVFKDDPLLCEPGSEYHYTAHGYTLLSAVLEKADGRTFGEMAKELFDKLEMRNTHLDNARGRTVVAHRTRYYFRNGRTHRLENVGEVDCSNKIAGGGILSCVGDLLKFANALLYSYEFVPKSDNPNETTLLQPSTVRSQWSPHTNGSCAQKWGHDYGLGWTLPRENTWDFDQMTEDKKGNVGAFRPRKYWYHLGGAVGASSILLIQPNGLYSDDLSPKGICIAILVNCQSCSCLRLAEELLNIFGNQGEEEVRV